MPVRSRTSRQRRFSFAFALSGNSLPIVLSLVHNAGTHPTLFYWGAVVALVSPVPVVLLPSRWRPLRWAFQYGGLVGLTMMQAYSGGPASPYALLLVMPAIWFGATVTGGELRAALALMPACCFLPMLIFGAPAYPVDVVTALILTIVVTSVIGSLALFTRETGRLTTRLNHEATHDRLTDLLNRRGWDDTTEHVLPGTSRKGPVCVLLIDLDGLKAVNDSEGHDQGDRLIQDTGTRLRAAFGATEIVARLGGDEFAVLFVRSPAADVMTRVEQMRESTPGEGAFSAGLAAAVPGEKLGDVMRRADLALYEVKKTGRGRTQLASAPIDLTGYRPPLAPTHHSTAAPNHPERTLGLPITTTDEVAGAQGVAVLPADRAEPTEKPTQATSLASRAHQQAPSNDVHSPSG